MLDVVAKMLPAAATIAVASLSMFNVGYFWKIGLHFLGIVDWNNIVYSFGLAFGLWMVLVLVGLRLVDIFSEPASELSVHRSRRTNKIVMWIGVGIFLIASWNPGQFISDIVEAGAQLVGVLLFWSAWSLQSSLDYKTSGVAKADDLIVGVLVAFLIFFQAGIFVAEWQMNNLDTYTVGTTKGASIENARLLRASSAGFIVFAEERVLFIPQSQIARIMATPKFIAKPADRLCPWGYINLGDGRCMRCGLKGEPCPRID
jgi:hypothetical protein